MHPVPNPVHAYTAPGAYHVDLTVTRGINKDSYSQTIIAGGVPGTDFSADITTTGVNSPVRLPIKRSIHPPHGIGILVTGQLHLNRTLRTPSC